MAAMLTLYPRRGLLEAIVTGQSFHLPLQNDGERVAAWEHQFEYRSGKHTVWEAAFQTLKAASGNNATLIYTAAGTSTASGIYDFPGEYAQRFDGVAKGGDASHSHAGTAIYVGTRSNGIYLHSLPVCSLKSCLVVLQQWDSLRSAIAGEKRLSFAVSV